MLVRATSHALEEFIDEVRFPTEAGITMPAIPTVVAIGDVLRDAGCHHGLRRENRIRAAGQPAIDQLLQNRNAHGERKYRTGMPPPSIDEDDAAALSELSSFRLEPHPSGRGCIDQI